MQIEVSANPWKRVKTFIDAFHYAPNNADIEIRIGREQGGGPVGILVSINGKHYPLLTSEARKVADVMEDAMRQFPNDPESATLPNIIWALRTGCDKAELE